VGSLVRPPAIREALALEQAGKPFDKKAFEATLHTEVAEVVRKQVEVGIDVPSDGEFGKPHWISYITERIGGAKPVEFAHAQHSAMKWVGTSPDRTRFAEFYAAYAPVERYDWCGHDHDLSTSLSKLPAPAMLWNFDGKVSYVGQDALQRDIANLRNAVSKAQATSAFLPVASVMAAEAAQPNPAYASEDEFLYALADALREEYKTIVDAGFYVQLDDAVVTQLYGRTDWTDTDKRKFVEKRVEVINHALRGIPEDKVRFHICWGSWNGPHSSDAPLKSLIDPLLKVNAKYFLIEAANPRHEHEWQIWKEKKWPEGKVIVPGVVNHQTNVLEHPELVALRLLNFANVVGRDHIMAGSDCGFCQGWMEIRVHPSIQWAKLESLVEGARLASKQLWKS
jgi:5-methyltetrahydropteroyltriglutamate--homocysteine methyltransferase